MLQSNAILIDTIVGEANVINTISSNAVISTTINSSSTVNNIITSCAVLVCLLVSEATLINGGIGTSLCPIITCIDGGLSSTTSYPSINGLLNGGSS